MHIAHLRISGRHKQIHSDQTPVITKNCRKLVQVGFDVAVQLPVPTSSTDTLESQPIATANSSLPDESSHSG